MNPVVWSSLRAEMGSLQTRLAPAGWICTASTGWGANGDRFARMATTSAAATATATAPTRRGLDTHAPEPMRGCAGIRVSCDVHCAGGGGAIMVAYRRR